MADFISTYHGTEFEEGLRRIIFNDPQSFSWIDKGTMTADQFYKFNEIGNWKIRINPYSTDSPEPYDYNVAIFDRNESGTIKRYRVVVMSRGDTKKLYEWNGTMFVWNGKKGMFGEISAIAGVTSVPAPGSNATYDYCLLNDPAENGIVVLYGKAADGRTWIPVIQSDAMKESVYDPSKRKKPPLQYLEDTYITPDTTTPQMLKTHIPDKIIHISALERKTWVQAPTKTQLQAWITEAKEYAKKHHNDVVEAAGGGITQTDTKITKATTDLQYHINDKTADGSAARTDKIHITQKDRDYFNSKAPGNHRHEASAHRVQISTAKVVSGVFSMDRMPDAVKMKVRVVASRDAMLHFTPAGSVHKGDVFHIVAAGSPDEWWRVIDTTKLTTLDGYLDFTVKPDSTSGDWANVKNKPTTVAGFGITDLYTKKEVEDRSDKSYVDKIHDMYYDPNGNFMGNTSIIGFTSRLMWDYRYPQGYRVVGSRYQGSYRKRIGSLDRIVDRLNELKYMKSRNTENFVNGFNFTSAIRGSNVANQFNPYQIYYPFFSEVKLRNPIYSNEVYGGHGTVISFDRFHSTIYYTKVNDGVMHMLDLAMIQFTVPMSQHRLLDATTTNMTSLIASTAISSVFTAAGYVMNIAPIPAIAYYDKTKTPWEYKGMDNGGIAIVFRAYSLLIPFNDRGILDLSKAEALAQSGEYVANNRPVGVVIPQKRLEIEPYYSDRYTDRTKILSAKGRYPIGFTMRWVLYIRNNDHADDSYIYVKARRYTVNWPDDSAKGSHYVGSESTDHNAAESMDNAYSSFKVVMKSTAFSDLKEACDPTNVNNNTFIELAITAMVYGAGDGPVPNSDYASVSDRAKYCGRLALATDNLNSAHFSKFLFSWDGYNKLQIRSYMPISDYDVREYKGGFYSGQGILALYDSKTVFNLDANKFQVAMYGKMATRYVLDGTQIHSVMELLVVQNPVYTTTAPMKDPFGGNRIDAQVIRHYNDQKDQIYVVPINQLINDFKSRRKNLVVSVPCPSYEATIDMTAKNPELVITSGNTISWHILDASLSDIYYFDYTSGRYLMIVGTEYRSFYDGTYTVSSHERRNSANMPLRESEIVFLESYDECKSFQVVKIVPKFRPEDLLAARNEYPISIADSNLIMAPGTYGTTLSSWNVGANAKIAVVVQDEVAYIYNGQDSQQLSNPRIVSLNTFNDRVVDEIHETMSPYPYDASGERWNPIIKEMAKYRQYMYFEDGVIYYRESVDGIIWKTIAEEIRTSTSTPFVETLLGGTEMYHMDQPTTEREGYYKDAPSIESATEKIWASWDRYSIAPVNPQGRTYRATIGNGSYQVSSSSIRVNTKLGIYYVYNDKEYRLLVMDGYEGYPVVLGYNKVTKKWLEVRNGNAAAQKRMPWALRPGAISLITRNDSFIDGNNKLTYFYLLSRDKMAGDFTPGLIANGTVITDPVIVDTLVCGNKTSAGATSPAVDVRNVNVLIPQRNGNPVGVAAKRHFTRFRANGTSDTGIKSYTNAMRWDFYQLGVADAMKQLYISASNHENTFELIKGTCPIVIQGFDIRYVNPTRYAHSSLRDDNREDLTWSTAEGFSKKVEDWLLAKAATASTPPPATGVLGDVVTMYAYSDSQWVTNDATIAVSAHSKTYKFPMSYLPKAYILFALSGMSKYGLPDGIYRVTITIPSSIKIGLNYTASEGVNAKIAANLNVALSTIIDGATVELFMALPQTTTYRSLIKSRYLRSYSKEKTGVHALTSAVMNPSTDQASSMKIGEEETGRKGFKTFSSRSTTVPVHKVDEIPSRLNGPDLDSYTEPSRYNVQDRLGLDFYPRPLARGTSYRNRNTNLWYGPVPYLTGKTFKSWYVNPEDTFYPYNTSYVQTITDPSGYTIFGTNQTVVAKSYFGMYSYLYRFNVAYKETKRTMEETNHLVTEMQSILTTGMDIFTN